MIFTEIHSIFTGEKNMNSFLPSEEFPSAFTVVYMKLLMSF
jgi:hypothetical protein